MKIFRARSRNDIEPPSYYRKTQIGKDYMRSTFMHSRHVLLHGTPLHAMITYIDANFMIRALEGAHSVGVARGQATLG